MPIYIVDSCSSRDSSPYTLPAYSLSLPTEICFSYLFEYLARNICGIKTYF